MREQPGAGRGELGPAHEAEVRGGSEHVVEEEGEVGGDDVRVEDGCGDIVELLS